MTKPPHVQWRCDNQKEIEDLLKDRDVRIDRSGDTLLITSPKGLEIELKPGESLIRDGDSLGHVTVEQTSPTEMIDTVCVNCLKPLRMYKSVYESVETLGVVCSDLCEKQYIERMRANAGIAKEN